MDTFQRSVPPDGTEPERVVEAIQRTNERGFFGMASRSCCSFLRTPRSREYNAGTLALRFVNGLSARGAPEGSSQWGRSRRWHRSTAETLAHSLTRAGTVQNRQICSQNQLYVPLDQAVGEKFVALRA